MKYYSDIKDIILYSDPLVGDLTLDYLLEMIEVCIEETQIFENSISKILHKNPSNQKIADKLMNTSMKSEIKFLIDLIKDNL